MRLVFQIQRWILVLLGHWTGWGTYLYVALRKYKHIFKSFEALNFFQVLDLRLLIISYVICVCEQRLDVSVNG